MIVVVMGWKQEQSRKAGELAAAAAMLKTIEQMKRSVMWHGQGETWGKWEGELTRMKTNLTISVQIKQQQKQNQAEYLGNKLPSWPSSFSSSADDDQPKSPNNTSRKVVPVFQITPQQLHMAMQQFFRSQQSKDSDSGDSTTSISSIASSTGTELAIRKRLKSNSSTSTSVKEEDADAVMVLEEEDAAEDNKVEEYVDVVGDGEARTNSFLKMQRKAHIEFYRYIPHIHITHTTHVNHSSAGD